MKFTCNKSDINNALNNVSRAVPSKHPIAALEGIKLSLNGNTLTLTGYGLEMGIQTNISVESDDSAEYILNSKLFCEIIRKMPAGKITIEINSKMQISITSENAKYKITALSAETYPSLPDIEASDSLTISQPLLKNMISQTIFAVSTSDAKPILTGELFDISDNIFNLVAIDGFRLAVRTEKLDNSGKHNFVVKAKTLSEIVKLLNDKDDSVATLHISKKHIVFDIGKYKVISRLLEGDFHNYKGSLPKNHSTEVIINTKRLSESLNRCQLLINDKSKGPIRINFKDGQVRISCSTALGSLKDEFEADISGSPVEIGFNCRYLLDAVKASESDKVKLQLNNGLSPMKILPLEGEDYTFLVLPVRLKVE